MTEADQQALTAAFARWFKGNQAAMRLCADLTEVAHVWDDLVDHDRAVPAEDADNAFRKLLIDIPSNAFYRANFDFLLPIFTSVWSQWYASTKMEADPHESDRAKCFMLRASLYQLYHMVAVLCGGLEWARDLGPEIYRFYGEKLETF